MPSLAGLSEPGVSRVMGLGLIRHIDTNQEVAEDDDTNYH